MIMTDFQLKEEITKLAKITAEEYIQWNKTPLVRAGFVICDEEHFRGMKLSKELVETKCACYVLVKKEGILRGCMGTLSAVENDFASEIIRNTIAAVSKDVRFESVTAEELPLLEYSIFCVADVVPVAQEKYFSTDNGVSYAREVPSADNSASCASNDDSANKGVIVSAGCRQAIVLPFEDEGLSFADKIKEACIRGNISLDEKPLVKEIIFA